MPAEPEAEGAVRLVIPADSAAVRQALRALLDTLMLRALPDPARDTAQLVLAEALNNIVEHAYGPAADGQIEVTLTATAGGLACLIVDRGGPMPQAALPAGRLPEPAAGPEGGWGWHLIRSLSRDLTYSRSGGRNTLSFQLDRD